MSRNSGPSPRTVPSIRTALPRAQAASCSCSGPSPATESSTPGNRRSSRSKARCSAWMPFSGCSRTA